MNINKSQIQEINKNPTIGFLIDSTSLPGVVALGCVAHRTSTACTLVPAGSFNRQRTLTSRGSANWESSSNPTVTLE